VIAVLARLLPGHPAAALDRDTGNPAGLAPASGEEEMDLPGHAGTTADPGRGARVGGTAGAAGPTLAAGASKVSCADGGTGSARELSVGSWPPPGSGPRRGGHHRPPGSPGALLHRGYLRTAHATHHGTRPRQAAWAVQVVCCSTVFPASRDGCFVRWQVACTRCVRLPRAALGVSWWTR
jgi:hypothetical protein